jgi:hypothetical protein
MRRFTACWWLTAPKPQVQIGVGTADLLSPLRGLLRR